MALQSFGEASLTVLSSAVTKQGVAVAEDGLVIQSLATKRLVGSAKYGLIFCHGYTDQWDSPLNDGTMGPTISEIIHSGPWIVYSINAGGDSWGNDTAVSRVASGVNVLRSHYGVPSESVYGLGVSMGNLSILNGWKADTTLFRRSVGLLPIVSLDSIHSGNVQGAAAAINTAYGGTWVNATQRADHDPAFYVSASHPFGTTGDWLGFGSGADEWQPGSIWSDFAASNQHLNFRQITPTGSHSWDQISLVPTGQITSFLLNGTLP